MQGYALRRSQNDTFEEHRAQQEDSSLEETENEESSYTDEEYSHAVAHTLVILVALEVLAYAVADA